MEIVPYSARIRAWERRNKRIREKRAKGETYDAIAKQEKISRQRVKQICDKGAS